MQIGIEQAASDNLKELLKGKNLPQSSAIRIFQSGMGCSGAAFNLAQDEKRADDVSFEYDGMEYVAEKSLIDLYDGFDIRYMDEGNVQGIYIEARNPGESAGGCASCSGCSPE